MAFAPTPLFDIHHDQLALGDMGERDCPKCGRRSAFTARIVYRYVALLYVFGFLTHREYLLVCGRCLADVSGAEAEIREKYPVAGIPFMRRRGLLVCVAMIASAIIAYHAVDYADSLALARQSEAYLASPLTGDRYLVDLARVPGGGIEAGGDPETPRARVYSVLRLTAIAADRLVFVPATLAYGKARELREMLDSPLVMQYDGGKNIVLTREEASRLLRAEIILEIRRG